MNAVFDYDFADGKLFGGGYVFIEEHTNKNDYISDYNNVKEILTREYGSPTIDSTEWRNDLYKNDPQYWGLAISKGHLIYLNTWETQTTEIVLILGGDNFKIKFVAGYTSNNFKYPYVEEEIEKQEGEF